MEEKNLNMEQEAQGHHEGMEEHTYDGIEELDNPPPRWIMMLFYITIGFSILYAAHYFWLDVGDTQDERYAKRSQAHDEKYQLNSGNDGDFVYLSDAESLEAGKAVYQDMACATCHGAVGEGNPIGPNLTDDYWLSDCDFQGVFDVIKNGNPTKGMTAFGGQISDTKIQQVASYVMSLRGSNPPNAKDAQGNLCE